MNILNIDKLVPTPKVITGSYNGETVSITIEKIPAIYVLRVQKLSEMKDSNKANLKLLEIIIEVIVNLGKPAIDRETVLNMFTMDELGEIWRYLCNGVDGNEKKNEDK